MKDVYILGMGGILNFKDTELNILLTVVKGE